MKIASRLAWIVILLLATTPSAFSDDKERVIVQGKFNAPLDSEWFWFRENPEGWKVEDGALQIRVLPGHVFSKHNTAQNLLLRKPPDTSKRLAIEVFVKAQPKVMFEEAGLIWFCDEDNYLVLSHEKLREVHLRMIREVGGAASFPFEKAYEHAGVWLRLVVSDGKATSYYRQTEKEEWQKMGGADLPAKGAAKIGLIAGGGPKDTDRWAEFRDFRILELVE